MKKTSPLWVFGPRGKTVHRKREYTKAGGRTLCGIHVRGNWLRLTGDAKHWHKCKRCAA